MKMKGMSLFANVYSPSRDGEVLNSETDSLELREKTFTDNVKYATESDLVVAIIDNRDAGTMVEVGMRYAHDKAMGKLVTGARANIMTFSNYNYGINLMLTNAVIGHYTDLQELLDSIIDLYDDEFNYDEIDKSMMEFEVY